MYAQLRDVISINFLVKTNNYLAPGRGKGYWTSLPLKPISQLRFDHDTITTRLRRKTDMLIFCSRRMEAGARDTS